MRECFRLSDFFVGCFQFLASGAQITGSVRQRPNNCWPALHPEIGLQKHAKMFQTALPYWFIRIEARARQLLGLCLTETGDLRAAREELEASYKTKSERRKHSLILAYVNARAEMWIAQRNCCAGRNPTLRRRS